MPDTTNSKGSLCFPADRRWVGWTPLIVLPSLAFAATLSSPAWLAMWALAISIFAACKWFTWREARLAMPVTLPRSLGYLFLWPGMDARAFLNPASRPVKPAADECIFALLKIAFGALLIWGVPQMVPPHLLLLRGWIGMVGLIFMLHFGNFYLLSWMWRKAGVNAETLMQFPLIAKTLDEFWSKRWNRGFNDLVHDYVFAPLHPLVGVLWAMLLTFFFSGLIHEMVITVPARAGYGLPTLYFLLQSAGILLQRSRLGRLIGLRRGIPAHAFTFLLVAGPAYWLFPPPFVLRVMIPFLQILHSI